MSVVAAATTPMEAKKKPLENNKLKTCIQYYYYEWCLWTNKNDCEWRKRSDVNIMYSTSNVTVTLFAWNFFLPLDSSPVIRLHVHICHSYALFLIMIYIVVREESNVLYSIDLLFSSALIGNWIVKLYSFTQPFKKLNKISIWYSSVRYNRKYIYIGLENEL